MPDIHIERSHALGMARARAVAQQWVAQVEQDYGLACQYDAGEGCDLVQFSGAGVGGTVEVTADSFELNAQLGFLFSGFSDAIEQKLERNLDELLANGGRGPTGPEPRRRLASSPMAQQRKPRNSVNRP